MLALFLCCSLGYGEDDDKEGSFLTAPVGGGKLIKAVDEVSTDGSRFDEDTNMIC
jgi:hypothetical protein